MSKPQIKVIPPDPIDMVDLPCLSPVMGSVDRLDPFHGGVWRSGAIVAWENAKDTYARTQHLTFPRDWAELTQDTAMSILLDKRSRAALVKMCAVLLAFHNMTVQQLVAFTGSTSLTARGQLLRAAYRVGLVDLGQLTSPLGRDIKRKGWLVRLSPHTSKSIWKQHIELALTQAERAAVLGQQPWTAAGSHDRHNVLVAELALRAAESLVDWDGQSRLAALYGERYASHGLLAHGSYATQVSGFNAERRGDVLLVRSDGLQIVVEMTASVKEAERKATHWAQLMTNAPFRHHPFVVVFLSAVDVVHGKTSSNGPLADVAKGVRRTLEMNAGTTGNGTANRLFVADWNDWFPGRHQVNTAFADLVVRRRTTDDWEPVALMLEEFDFEPNDEAIKNASVLAGGPHWLRPKPVDPDWFADRLWPSDAARDAFRNPAPERPERAKGRPMRIAAKTPARLRVGNELHHAR